ncbi:MAG: hypothetical protein ABI867_43775, partial [Kofleriaceae bacterium]
MTKLVAAVLWGKQHDGTLVNGSIDPGDHDLANESCTIGHSTMCEIKVDGARIGGRRNSQIHILRDVWYLSHMGHAVPVRVAGEDIHTNGKFLAHADLIEPIAVTGGNPRFVFSTARPRLPRRARMPGDAVVWWPPLPRGITVCLGTEEGAFALPPDRACLIAGSPFADISIYGVPPTPIVRLRHTEVGWFIDHLDRGPPLEVAGAELRDDARLLTSGDVIEWPDGPTFVFELW